MNYTRYAIFVVSVLLAGCSGITVVQDYDPASNFDELTTFNWESETQKKTGDPRIDNPLRDTRTRAAVERVLHEKGFVRATEGTPAFYLRYQYVLRRKIESSGMSTGVGFGFGNYGRHSALAIGTGNTVRDYDEESLTIDFAGDKPETLFWRGTGAQRFVEYKEPEKNTRSINKLVEKILSQFPPPGK